jgi:hypothetical protein
MKTRIGYILVVILALVLNGKAKAQTKAEETKGVVVHADPRLAILVKKYRNVQLGVIRSGQGYRVQIYSGNDRAKAMQIKVDFMRRFPGIRTYLTYSQPQYRVKVGDFRMRQDAHVMYEQVSPLYNPSMIVPDIIVINTLKDD